MKKIMLNLFFLFLISSTDFFPQEFKTTSFFSDGFSWSSNRSSNITLIGSNTILQLRDLNNNVFYASLKIPTDILFFTVGENNTNHQSLIFAKLNYFGLNNLEKIDDDENLFNESESSIWDNEIIYFVIGAVAATTLYLVWQNSGSENAPQKTFGLPPQPEGNNGL